MKRLSDTSPEAQKVFEEIHRSMPAWRKWEVLGGLYQFGRELHAAGVLSRRPGAKPSEILDDWIATHLGATPVGTTIRETARVEQPADFRRTVGHVIAVLDRLGIAYALGGSLASSIHGISRNTIDADLCVDPFPGRELDFFQSFESTFYISLDAVRRALRERSSFNIIETATGFKVDLFIRKDRPFDLSLMSRRRPLTPPDSEAMPIQVVSPEDIILLKLEYEISERQWTDVRNVLRVQAGRLDETYLDHWAGQLGVADLLSRAKLEARE